MKNEIEITTPSEREVTVKRAFDAQAMMVFDAMTKPEILKLWYGQEGWKMTVCDVDLRIGGKWRFVSLLPSGKEIGQLGEYKEIIPGERLVNTENWEDWDAGETLVTTTFEEERGKTLLTCTSLFPTEEVRDFILKSGLEESAGVFYDKLASVLTAAKTN